MIDLIWHGRNQGRSRLGSGGALPDLTRAIHAYLTRTPLEEKPTRGTELPLKDEADVESLQQARLVVNKRRHNTLTNRLKCQLLHYTLQEGRDKAARFDVLVKDYDGKGSDLLVEVKSSSEAAHVRMAIGQLFAYWFHLSGKAKPHLAVLLPSEPDGELKSLLKWLISASCGPLGIRLRLVHVGLRISSGDFGG